MSESILSQIAQNTRERLERSQKAEPLSVLRARAEAAPLPRPFLSAFQPDTLNVIAEIKLASPSEGVLTETLTPIEIAQQYTENGAAALSVLTEPAFFHGGIGILETVGAAAELPRLMKDFILGEYQLMQARAARASAALLIVALLDTSQLKDLLACAAGLKLSALVEVHDAKELETALAADAKLIGVNNRNLKTLEIDLGTSRRLAPQLKNSGARFISESGLTTHAELKELSALGFEGFLIGSHFIKSGHPGAALADILKEEPFL